MKMLNLKENDDLIFLKCLIIFHFCQKYLKDLIFCNTTVSLQDTVDKVKQYCQNRPNFYVKKNFFMKY